VLVRAAIKVAPYADKDSESEVVAKGVGSLGWMGVFWGMEGANKVGME
jgi:hypothetical protein